MTLQSLRNTIQSNLIRVVKSVIDIDESIEARLMPLSDALIVSLTILCIFLLVGVPLGAFQILMIALPVALILWIFRTRDTTENLYFNSFSQGVDLLKDIDRIHAIETGVTLLIELSKQTDIYNGSIEKAFLSLLRAEVKEKPKDIAKDKRAYAQYILKWLDDKSRLDEINPSGILLFNQEFNLDNRQIAASFEKFHKKLLSLYGGEIETIKEQSINLDEAQWDYLIYFVSAAGSEETLVTLVLTEGPQKFRDPVQVFVQDSHYPGGLRKVKELLKRVGIPIWEGYDRDTATLTFSN